MTEHTPGPWRAFRGDRLTAHADDWCASAGPTMICSGIGFNDEAEANARLIAAAPDLLAALEEALSELETIDMNLLEGRDTYVSDTRMERIRAAITAARGAVTVSQEARNGL